MQEKLTGKERTALLYLAALDDEIHKASPILRERLRKTSPTGWRDWRLVQTTTARTLMQLIDTLTDKDVRWLSHMLEHGRNALEAFAQLAALRFPAPLHAQPARLPCRHPAQPPH